MTAYMHYDTAKTWEYSARWISMQDLALQFWDMVYWG